VLLGDADVEDPVRVPLGQLMRMPVDSPMAAVMLTMSDRSSARATSSSAKTPVHFTDGDAMGRPVTGSNAPDGLCSRSMSSSSAGW
jgi:hypothetical protein